MISNSSGNVTSRAARLTVTAARSAPTITTQPADQSIHAGQTATFSVVATGSAPLSYQWRRNGTAIPGATSASYTTPAQGTSDNGATFSVVISNSSGNVTSRNALLTVTPAVSTAGTDVVTYKNDLARTGQNLNEKTLTPANVKHARFGKLQFLSTDGKVDAQPLYLSALSIGGVKHNVVFVATENDSVYAFDADTGTQLWKASLVPAGETVAGELPQVVRRHRAHHRRHGNAGDRSRRRCARHDLPRGHDEIEHHLAPASARAGRHDRRGSRRRSQGDYRHLRHRRRHHHL